MFQVRDVRVNAWEVIDHGLCDVGQEFTHYLMLLFH